MHYERNQAWADLLHAESSKVWAGFEADRRDGAVTSTVHLGDDPQLDARALDELDATREQIRAERADQLPASYLDDLETQRAAVRAERDDTDQAEPAAAIAE